MNPIYCKVSLQTLEGREIPWYMGIAWINPDATVALACIPVLIVLRVYMMFYRWMCTPVEMKLIEEAYRRGAKDGYEAAHKQHKTETLETTFVSSDGTYKTRH